MLINVNAIYTSNFVKEVFRISLIEKGLEDTPDEKLLEDLITDPAAVLSASTLAYEFVDETSYEDETHDVIVQRTSDEKYFRLRYSNSCFEPLMIEVIPTEITTIIFEPQLRKVEDKT